ncbi:hypothetical protein ACWN8V_07235 [Vagococcus elongatus]|uniref:Uncharacterized protein n=1 Tax=Vagococcus elongatus TaxID=180344 RepID=A0A430AWA7_9ENTE|nr:hypothetical protein [Vagococcus elongatus]RSU12326.1 hypothetical protein CBF29_06910 [Vagococcus elongatus]
MATDKAFIHLDKIKSSAHMEHIAAPKAGLKAGQFVTLGAVSEDHDGEVLKYTNTTEKTKVDGLVAPVHLDYGYEDFDESVQVVKEGKIARVLVIERGDIVSMHSEMLTGVKAGDKLAVGKTGFALQKTESDEEAVAIAIAERYMPNIGDVIAVRFI